MASSPANRSIPKARPNRDLAAAPRNANLRIGVRPDFSPPHPIPSMNLPTFFEEDRVAVDASLDRLMPPEIAKPPSIHQAMRYSVFAGGKRIRPILCLETARLFESDIAAALHPASPMEMINTSSLIHYYL